MKKIKVLICISIFIAAGCKKPEQFSDVPSISFKSVSTQKDAAGFDIGAKVVISFTDGDGDIGYRPSGNGSPYDDYGGPYYYNFNILMDSLHAGSWITDVTDTLSGRIPYLTQDGSNKALKGEIEMDIPLPISFTHTVLQYQLRYTIFIYDRKLNKSNAVTSPEFTIRIH